ncbi:hypothetical protein OVY01_22710 [Robbsia sp. Bb-Pol-6]|uniref:YcaO domain-containing protein n=1 Tax=Robbsia betulipollinis TaxID=2981849 RepID=A0ABT3ZTQ7_9BURK|nr:hypothetical protein [Robbsia betulipollinis]MCY0389953.1 hypothetical protein [Robbsia betulipollinis]
MKSNVLSPDFYVYRTLSELPRRLHRRDVFVPAWYAGDGSESRTVFYFTVPSEHWSCLLVKGSTLTEAMVGAYEKAIDEAYAEGELDEDEAASERRRLKARATKGLVTSDETVAHDACLTDFAAAVQGLGRYRVWRSNPYEVEGMASMLEEAGWMIVPVLPAYSWRDVEYPFETERYRLPMVHAITRTPCPWSPWSNERDVYRCDR